MCGRLSPTGSRPPPPHPATDALAAAGPPPGSANFYFDSRWRVGGAAEDVQDPRAGGQRAGVRSLRRGWCGEGTWQSHPVLGAPCLYSFFSFFSLPPPGFKGTAPAEATGQAAAVSLVSRRPLRPGWTRSHRSASPKLQGVFRRTPGPGQSGCRAWLSRSVHNFYRVRLGWEIKLLDNCFPTQKQGVKRSEKFLCCSRNFIERPKTPRRYQ